MQRTFTDVACTVCGCVCDDLQLEVADGRITRARGSCALSEPWFASLSQPIQRPAAMVEGKPAAIKDAVERAVEILRASKSPFVWGLARGSTAGHRAAIALAEQVGGTIDTATSTKHKGTKAFQKLGQSTCSLGEVRNRADLLIFWRANPMVTHPRHLERYSAEPRGIFVPRGRADRTVVVIDAAATETSQRADTFLQISPDDDLQVIAILRKLVRNEEIGDSTLSLELQSQLQQLAAQMKECNYGAMFLGAGLGGSIGDFDETEELFSLVLDLNAFTRFTVHAMGQQSGAENVLTWQTGFPFAVSFAEGHPRFDPEKFAAEGLLERGEVDSCVLVGSECVGQLSREAQARLRTLPTIVLDYPNAELGLAATVQFTTAIYGVHAAGTAYRMDGVSIPLRKIVATEYSTDDDVLHRICERLTS